MDVLKRKQDAHLWAMTRLGEWWQDLLKGVEASDCGSITLCLFTYFSFSFFFFCCPPAFTETHQAKKAMDTTITPVAAPSEDASVASSSVSTPQTTSAEGWTKGITPIKAQYLVPKAAHADESLSHLSEAIESAGDQGRVEGEDGQQVEKNENNKRDRDQVLYIIFEEDRNSPLCYTF